MSDVFTNNNNSVWIISTFPPGYGGISVHTRNLLKLLKDNNVKVTLIRLNVNFIILLSSLLCLFFKLRSKQVVHLHTSFFSLPTLFLLFSLILLRWFVPFILIVSIHEGNIRTRTRSMGATRRWVIDFILGKLNVVVFMSGSQRQEIRRVFTMGKKEVVISPLIVRNDSLMVMKKIDLAHLHVLTIGQYNDLYGVSEILVAFNELCQRGLVKRIDLIMIFGSNNVDRSLRDQLLNNSNFTHKNLNVRILEDLDSEGIQKAFLVSDIFVRNTKADSFGLSLSEARMNGLHCLATDVCERPSGVYTYSVGNFSNAFISFIQNYCPKDNEQKLESGALSFSNFDDYKKLYFNSEYDGSKAFRVS